MPVRSVAVRLMAEVGNYVQGMGRAKAATGDLITELSKSEQQRANMQQLGTGMLVAGAGIAAGIGLATKAAMDWESAWTGVVKTVSGSEAQLSALEEELRAMARELPASHAEIAGVAEAAGQLGVKTEDIADFTRTMIQMGTATNLSAEEAATSLAQMANVMGTATDDVDRLGATIVGLGNNSATTEADIVSMAQRIAGAGATIGLSEADVLGFSAALASVGINAEAGGSAISRAMIDIESAVREGGEQLEGLAQVAGMSADEFAQAYEQDAAQAIATFIAGLGRMQASGENVFAVLDQLGFSEIRLRDALLRLASSGDLLTRSLDTGAEAWDANIALTEEAERRYATAASRIQIAQNQLNDFAIDMGAVFLPAVAEVADALGGFVGLLGDLPAPLVAIIGFTAAASAAILLLGGTAIVAVTKLAAYRAALASLNAAGGTTAVVAGRISRGMQRGVVWAGRAAAAFAALQLASVALDGVLGDDLNPQLDALGTGLQRWTESGQIGGEAARLLGDDFEKLRDAIGAVGDEGFWASVGNAIAGGVEGMLPFLKDVDNSAAKTQERIEAVDAAIAQIHQSGNAEAAAEAFAQIAAMAEEEGISMERLLEIFPQYAAALETSSEAGGETAEGMNEIGGAAQGAAEDVEALKEAFDELFGITMDLDRAQIAFREGMQELKEAVGEGAATLSLNTQAGRDNRSAVLDQIDAIAELRQANIDNGMSIEEANTKYDKQLDKIAEMLIDRGFEEKAVRELIDSYRDIPSQVSTSVETPGLNKARNQLRDLKLAIDRFPSVLPVNVIISQSGELPSVGRNIVSRWGSVTQHARDGFVHAQGGLLRNARVFGARSPARYAFAEPATGGEAFIPRLGNRRRSMSILNIAAGWYGASVVPDETSRPGYVLAEDGSWVPESFYEPDKVRMPKPGYVLAEDGSWVPKSFYAGSGAESEPERKPMPKPGFILAEDGSWVPKNFYDASATSPAATRRSMQAAAREMLEHIGGGGRVFEDFSYKGAPGLVKRFTDEFADRFYGEGGGFSIAAITRFLRGIKSGRFDSGGWLQPGVSLVENTTGRPERVLPPGQQLGGPWQWHGNSRPTGTTQQSMGVPSVRVFIGNRELTDIVRVEIDEGMGRHDDELMRFVGAGTGAAR